MTQLLTPSLIQDLTCSAANDCDLCALLRDGTLDTYFRPHSDGLEFLEDVRRGLLRDLFYLEGDRHVRGIPKGSQLVDQY